MPLKVNIEFEYTKVLSAEDKLKYQYADMGDSRFGLSLGTVKQMIKDKIAILKPSDSIENKVLEYLIDNGKDKLVDAICDDVLSLTGINNRRKRKYYIDKYQEVQYVYSGIENGRTYFGDRILLEEVLLIYNSHLINKVKRS